MVVECFKSDHQDYEKLKDIICKMHSGEANNITEDDDLILDFGNSSSGENRRKEMALTFKQNETISMFSAESKRVGR